MQALCGRSLRQDSSILRFHDKKHSRRKGNLPIFRCYLVADADGILRSHVVFCQRIKETPEGQACYLSAEGEQRNVLAVLFRFSDLHRLIREADPVVLIEENTFLSLLEGHG